MGYFHFIVMRTGTPESCSDAEITGICQVTWLILDASLESVSPLVIRGNQSRYGTRYGCIGTI